jgi:transcriptional regulator with XRE-family HTH domain
MRNTRVASAGVGQILRQLRREAGLTIEQVASKLGWDKSRLSRYETNQIGLSNCVLEKIAGAIGLPPAFVVLSCFFTPFEEGLSPRVKELMRAAIEASRTT